MVACTAKEWVFDLQIRYSFAKITNPTDPYGKAMNTFQSFTDRVISFLRNNDAAGLDIIQNGALDKIYEELPPFMIHSKFHAWVKEATVKHPHRRTAKQDQWLRIVTMQEHEPSINIVAMVLEASSWPSAWEKGAYDINSLLTDPDALYFFRNNHCIKDAEGSGSEFGESCYICANDFDAEIHVPQQAPCGHCQCRQCFQKLLSNKDPRYRCAFCRSCLLCGNQNCPHHIVEHDIAPPYPLHEYLESVHTFCKATCLNEEPLCGLSPKRYWELREKTRQDRARLSMVELLLAHDIAPEHRMNVERERELLLNALLFRATSAHLCVSKDKHSEGLAALRDIESCMLPK
jgi:hypothetical protein